MKKWMNLPVAVFLVSFVLGAIVFFPFANLRYPLVSVIRKNTGADLQIGHMWLGTGLGLGLAKGSILALRASDVTLIFPTGASLRCEDFTVSPHLISALIGRLEVGIGCNLGANQIVRSSIVATPIFSPQRAEIEADIKNLNLATFEGMMPIPGAAGILDGTVELHNFEMASRNPPQVSWDLKGREVTLPAIESDLINVPALPIASLKTKGSFEAGKLHLEDLTFGSAATPMEGAMHADLGLDRTFQPVSGEFKGRLRTDAGFETTQLKDIKLDLIFCKVKESGYREFTKKVNGNVLSLLMAPPIDCKL